MQISANDWQKYIGKLSAINKKAGDLLQAYIDKHGLNDIESVITYAHALVTKYGEAGSELACQMYDALAEAQGAYVNPAEPATIANRHEVAGALLKTQGTLNMIPAIERLVKTAASDTMLKNAKRDNAEWAWVSHGDTCAFCMHLSSLGWMPASKAILRGEHAEHIHANCDCEFAIRFDGKSTVEGYSPQKFKKIFDNAEGNTLKDKINAIRREQSARNYQKIIYSNGHSVYLSKDEYRAINRYISSESYTLNEALRTQAQLSNEQKKMVSDLDSVIEKLPKFNGNVTRSLMFPDDESARKFISSLNSTDVVNFKQYISATTSSELYNEGGQVQIAFVNTKSCADLTPLNQGEMEVLFGRGAKFKLKECEEQFGKFWIVMEESKS